MNEFDMPFYYQVAASILTLAASISATITIIVAMNGLANLQLAKKKVRGRRNSEVRWTAMMDLYSVYQYVFR